MGIKSLGKRLSHAFVYAMEKIPIMRRELFSKDGFGPTPDLVNYPMTKYRGPLYPAPLRPNATVAIATKTLCNNARRAWASRDFKRAETTYRQVLEREPRNPDVLFELAQLLWLLHRNDEAQALLEQAKDLDRNHYQSRVSLVFLTAQTGGKSYAHLISDLPYIQPPPPSYVFDEAVRRIRL